MQRLAILAIFAVIMLTACPSGGGGTGAGGNSSASSSSSSTAAAPPPAPVIIPAGTLGWRGWQLGSSWDDAKTLFDPALRTIEAWVEPGKLGMVTVIPQGGEPLPEHVLVFTSGQLVGYNFSNYMPIEQFGNMKAEVVESLGEPVTTPPEWALNTPYFEGYKPPIAELQIYYWHDEAAKAVLQLMYNGITDLGVVALVNVEHFNQANKDIAAAGSHVFPGSEDALAEKTSSSDTSAADEQPVEITASPFTIDGYSLDLPFTTVQADYPNDGTLLLDNMWAVEKQTGMFGASPSDLSKSFPSIAAWFLDGKLAGYIRNEEMTREEFIAATDMFDKDYGPGNFDPPAWLKHTPYQDEYQEPGPDSEQLIWDDEASRSILIAQYDYEQNLATFMMFDTYAYPRAMYTTMSSLGYGK